MGKVLKYSVLRYSPSLISGECVNIGIIFSEEELGYHFFYFTNNFSRIKVFDDELDKTVLMDLCVGIKEQIESVHTSMDFNIDCFTKYYINDFRFESPRSIVYNDLDKQIENLKKLYFRYDYDKSQRPSKNDEAAFIKNILDATSKKYQRNVKTNGVYGEQIKYDYVIDDSYIKLFDYSNKDLSKCINSAKTWAWNSNKEINKKIYIIYRTDESAVEMNKNFKIISDIFKESNVKFCSLEDFPSIAKQFTNSTVTAKI